MSDKPIWCNHVFPSHVLESHHWGCFQPASTQAWKAELQESTPPHFPRNGVWTPPKTDDFSDLGYQPRENIGLLDLWLIYLDHIKRDSQLFTYTHSTVFSVDKNRTLTWTDGDRFTSGSFISKHPDVKNIEVCIPLKKKRNLSLLRWLKGKFQGKVKRPKDVFRGWIPADEHHLLQALGVQYGNHIISYHIISSHNPNAPNDPKRLQYSSHSTSHIPITPVVRHVDWGMRCQGPQGHTMLSAMWPRPWKALRPWRAESFLPVPLLRKVWVVQVMSNQINQ